jgi:hypothetical protein
MLHLYWTAPLIHTAYKLKAAIYPLYYRITAQPRCIQMCRQLPAKEPYSLIPLCVAMEKLNKCGLRQNLPRVPSHAPWLARSITHPSPTFWHEAAMKNTSTCISACWHMLCGHR